MNSRRNIILMVGFLLLAALFFFVRDSSCEWLICRRWVAVPTLFAALAAFLNFRCGGLAIPLALLFSAAGDWAGSTGNFIMQVAFFAVAHLFYIADFAPHKLPIRNRASLIAIYTLPLLVFLLYILVNIALSHSTEELIAVGIYGAIIYTMGFFAILQNRGHLHWYILAACLFIFSDSCIAFGRFVNPIPHNNTIVMTTYYAAQGIFLALHLQRERK